MNFPSFTLNPIKFLVNPEQLQQFMCIICLQKSLILVRCKSCKNCLCNQCAIDQKTTNNKCPYRCTSGQLQLQPLTFFNLSFKCPYSQHCKQILKSTKKFYEHDRNCAFITYSQQQEQQKKWEFRCQENHPLQIVYDTCQNLLKRRKCSSCQLPKLTRAMCRKCNEYFCFHCRPIPIWNLKCPIGHKFEKLSNKISTYVCDICELYPQMLNLDVYHDDDCNFSICSLCYENYPKFEKPVIYSSNLNNYCDFIGSKDLESKLKVVEIKKILHDHELIILSEQQIKKCWSCQKEKLCYKKCSNCEKYFCFQCKIMDINTQNQCKVGHEFIEINKFGHSIQGEINVLSCYACQKEANLSGESFYFDSNCRVSLCSECLQYSKSYNEEVICRKRVQVEQYIPERRCACSIMCDRRLILILLQLNLLLQYYIRIQSFWMAVQRKGININVVGSFFMIITAGTLYRLSSLNRKILKTQFSNILQSLGNKLYSAKPLNRGRCLPSENEKLQIEKGQIAREIKQLNLIKRVVKFSKWM